MSTPKQRGLGRGLESLIPMPGRAEGSVTQMIAVDQVKPSSEQVRGRFDAEPLRELAESIRAHGLLQPILVRRQADGYELIAGERRWRAARMAGLERIPAVVRGESEHEEERLVLGLIENLQRQDLDPMEEARGYKRLIERFGLTHEQVADSVGKHRVSISQAMRLLNACPALQSAVSGGAISAGHARALVGLPAAADQEHGLKVVLARRLSVRQTERWVQAYQPARPQRPKRADLWAAEFGNIAAELQEHLGLGVSITGGPDGGRITITYSTRADLERLHDKLLA